MIRGNTETRICTIALENSYTLLCILFFAKPSGYRVFMTQEPERQANEPAAAKLMIDRPSDFKFHVAYLAYSHAWDKTASQETRTKLNEIILSLSNQEVDYSTFYEEMGQYTGNISKHYAWPRDAIVTQRKRDWRKREERAARNARHRGRR